MHYRYYYGGEGGFVGTVAGLEEGGGVVIVQWDMGQRCTYRCGQDNKFDLRVLDRILYIQYICSVHACCGVAISSGAFCGGVSGACSL